MKICEKFYNPTRTNQLVVNWCLFFFCCCFNFHVIHLAIVYFKVKLKVQQIKQLMYLVSQKLWDNMVYKQYVYTLKDIDISFRLSNLHIYTVLVCFPCHCFCCD